MPAIKSRYWFITFNNPPEPWRKWFDDAPVDWMYGQLEKGKNGTEHIQGVCYFHDQTTLNQAKVKLGSQPHLEPLKGEEGIAYVCKEDTRIDGPYEKGTKPKVGVKYTTKEILETPIQTLVEEDRIKPMSVVRMVQNQIYWQLIAIPQVTHNHTRGIWLWGESGVGKSSLVRRSYPQKEIFLKPQNKWWDGYNGQKIIVLDDLDEKYMNHGLKIYADHFPCKGEMKGFTIPLHHHYFIVTSNFQIRDLCDHEETIAALERRFIVHEMTPQNRDQITLPPFCSCTVKKDPIEPVTDPDPDEPTLEKRTKKD